MRPTSFREAVDRSMEGYSSTNAIGEFLRDSPIAFRPRLIFTEAEPLRRARFSKGV